MIHLQVRFGSAIDVWIRYCDRLIQSFEYSNISRSRGLSKCQVSVCFSVRQGQRAVDMRTINSGGAL